MNMYCQLPGVGHGKQYFLNILFFFIQSMVQKYGFILIYFGKLALIQNNNNVLLRNGINFI